MISEKCLLFLGEDRIKLINEIYNEWKSGLTQKQLAKKYNCGERTIGRRISRHKLEMNRNG